jgi:hypothetical protein
VSGIRQAWSSNRQTRIAFHDSLGIGLGVWVVDMLDMREAMIEYILTRAGHIGAKSSACDNEGGETEAPRVLIGCSDL